MHAKYFDVLEYFRESRMQPQVSQTLKEFQDFDQTYQEMRLYLETLKADNLDPDVEGELTDEARAAIKRAELRSVYDSLRERMAHEKFVEAKHINIEMMKYAMEIIDREEKEEQERKRKQAAKEFKKEPGFLGSLLGLQANAEHLAWNMLIFLILLSLWGYFREDFYRYMFFSGNQPSGSRFK